MTNWDDFIYLGESEGPARRKGPILHFCLNCGEDYRIRGKRYRVPGSTYPALLLDKACSIECPTCKFPVYSSSQYILLSRAAP